MAKYEHWHQVLCDELCDEMKKFEEHPSKDRLEGIKELIESICGLNEIEAAGAMREFAEDRYGYDSDTGHFNPGYAGANMYNGMYNAGRKRDSRGRYMSMYDSMPPYYQTPYVDMPPMYNDGRMYDDRRMDRGRMDMDGPYMLRQEGGKPVMTPYAHHDMKSMPKKLTKEQYDEWMENIVNADGSTGPHWTEEQTKKVQAQKGLEKIDSKAFWAAMNASYSDLCDFFKKHNLNTDAVCEYTMAFWFEDEDAVGGGECNTEKLAAYYSAVVDK